MIFRETPIPGVFVLEPERSEDERGFFARTWCAEEFAAHGLDTRVAQCSISFNSRAGTLRGMHYQAAPHEETKVVRCTAGAIYDVALDLRPDSPTFRAWTAVELSAENRAALYLPQGIAHGFQTLQDASEVLYMISVSHAPKSACGVRWDDPAFRIEWPAVTHRTISCGDLNYPLVNGEKS